MRVPGIVVMREPEPVAGSAPTLFALGSTLRWRQFVALQFLHLGRPLLSRWTKLATGRNASCGSLRLHTKSRAPMAVIARMTIRRALLLVFYQCLRNALLYAERSAKWLPTFGYLFGDVF